MWVLSSQECQWKSVSTAHDHQGSGSFYLPRQRPFYHIKKKCSESCVQTTRCVGRVGLCWQEKSNEDSLAAQLVTLQQRSTRSVPPNCPKLAVAGRYDRHRAFLRFLSPNSFQFFFCMHLASYACMQTSCMSAKPPSPRLPQLVWQNLFLRMSPSPSLRVALVSPPSLTGCERTRPLGQIIPLACPFLSGKILFAVCADVHGQKMKRR